MVLKISTRSKMGTSRDDSTGSERTARLALQKVVDFGWQAGEINQIIVEPPQSSLGARRGLVGESAIGGRKFRKRDGAARQVVGQSRPGLSFSTGHGDAIFRASRKSPRRARPRGLPS